MAAFINTWSFPATSYGSMGPIAPVSAPTSVPATVVDPVVSIPVVATVVDNAAPTSQTPQKVAKTPKAPVEPTRKSSRVPVKRVFADTVDLDDDAKWAEFEATQIFVKKPKADKPPQAPVTITPPVVVVDVLGVPVSTVPQPTAPAPVTVPVTTQPDVAADKPAVPAIRGEHRIPVMDLKVGDILSTVVYHKVKSVDGPSRFVTEHLREEKERDWHYTSPTPFACHSASKYDTVVKLNKTDLVKQFIKCDADVFTVTYQTKLDETDLPDKLVEKHAEIVAAGADKAGLRKIVKDIYGEHERTMVGRMLNSENNLGYSLVDQLDSVNPAGAHKVQFRQVNHRTVSSLIYQNVKYELKK